MVESTPNELSYGLLKLCPIWDDLRGSAGFESLVPRSRRSRGLEVSDKTTGVDQSRKFALRAPVRQAHSEWEGFEPSVTF